MSRRSARLVSGGHYHSDSDSDSSSATNTSYHEGLQRAFKKKAGLTRKVSTRSSIRANQSARSVGTAGPQTGPGPEQDREHLAGLVSEPTQVPHTPAPTPRPALTPVSGRQTLAPGPNAPPESSLQSGLPGGLPGPRGPPLGQAGVDSSGYSSAEGPRRRTCTPTTSSAPPAPWTPGREPGPGAHRRGTSSAERPPTDSAVGPGMRTAIGGFLLLLLLILCMFLLVPLLVSLTLHPPAIKTTPPTPSAVRTPHLHPATPPPAPPPAPQPCSSSLEENRLLQEQQVLRARLEELEERVSSREERLALRISALETAHTQMRQELSSVQTRSCPEPDPPAPRDQDQDQDRDQEQLSPQLQHALEEWLSERMKHRELGGASGCAACDRPMADRMADFALESQGASVVSTRCSETYSLLSARLSIFGVPLWYPTQSPRTVIQGHAVLLPGRCWAFRGARGSLVVSLSHAVCVSHVTLDHLPRYSAPTGRIDSAPRDFLLYGMQEDSPEEEATLLGSFTYDQEGASTQTFSVAESGSVAYRRVELRVLSNWGHMTYTCLYRFRVHGKMAAAAVGGSETASRLLNPNA